MRKTDAESARKYGSGGKWGREARNAALRRVKNLAMDGRRV